MKMDAMARRAGRPSKENSGQVGRDFQGKESREIIAEQTGESARQVQRFINLTNLIPELLDMVDRKEIAFNPAVELSFLKKRGTARIPGSYGLRAVHSIVVSGTAD